MSLKEVKRLVADGRFEDAEERLRDALEDQPNDYQLLSVQGAVLERLGEQDKAAAALLKATKVDAEKLTAWKGLVKIYKESENWPHFVDAFPGYTHACVVNDQLTAAQNDFQALERHIRSGKASSDLSEKFWRLELPDSPLFGVLKMPSPRDAAQRLLKLQRKTLATTLTKLKASARMNISYTPSRIRKERLAAYNQGDISSLCETVIAYSGDNETLRRETEAELLQFLYEKLSLVPPQQKQALRDKVSGLAEDMILFEPREPLAFLIVWDWADFKGYEEFEYAQLRKFSQLFPDSVMARVIEGFLHSPLSPFDYKAEEKRLRELEESQNELKDTRTKQKTSNKPIAEEELEDEPEWSPQELADAFSLKDASSGTDALAYRIVTDFYVQNEDWKLAVETAKQGLDIVDTQKADFDVDLPNTKTALSLLLGRAYTHFQAPRNFPLAEEMFDKVLVTEPETVAALVGKGMILIERQKWSEAEKLLETAYQAHPGHLEALSELSWCKINSQSDVQGGVDGLSRCLELSLHRRATQGLAHFRAETRWRIGYACWTFLSDGNRALDEFVGALKESPTFAAAFTYLGLVYESRGDTARATKCFYKALEIDNGQVLAGERLATMFAAQGQWELVRVVASLVLGSAKLESQAVAWPYRAMGIVLLNADEYVDAVKYFQKCLRIEPTDSNSWVGLGEAYIGSGRYQSAEKALKRALELSPDSFSALYGLSMAQRQVLDFPGAAESIRSAINVAPAQSASSPALIWALIDNSARAAHYYLDRSLFGDAMDEARFVLTTAIKELGQRPEHATVWDGLADALSVFVSVGSSELPVSDLEQIASLASTTFTTPAKLRAAVTVQALKVSGPTKSERAMRNFNAAIAHASLDLATAIEHCKQAVAISPRNPLYWRTYGTIVARANSSVAQHCYVRSLALDGHAADTWVALGSLYLDQGDGDLASEAFDRALFADPDCYRAWAGQALVDAAADKDADTVLRTLLHSYSLAPGQDTTVSLLLGLEAYSTSTASALVVGALEKLLTLQPHNRRAAIALTLLLERRGDYVGALERVPESHEPLKARLMYTLGRFDDAIELAASALESTLEWYDQLSCLVVAGLAAFRVGDFDTSIDMLLQALELAKSTGDHENAESAQEVIAQVLYAQGTPESRREALDQLWDSVAVNGATLTVTLLLGVIGLVDNDAEVIEAAREELAPLMQGSQLTASQRHRATRVLSLLEGGSTRAYQRAVFDHPADYELWKHLSATQAVTVAESTQLPSEELSEAYAAVGGLQTSQRAVFYSPTSTKAWQSLATVLSQPDVASLSVN